MLKILEALKYTSLYETILPISLQIELRNWYKRKKLPPTPQLIKHKIIRELGDSYSFKTLVETGTYLGVMINANKNYFKEIFTIELNKKLYERAKRKFAKFKHIKVIQGDSTKILPDILREIKSPALFWLDAHYSGGITAKGKTKTPIVSELKHILNSQSLNHFILIDDALDFNEENDYPTINELKNFILKRNKNYKVSIANNIIYILPK